MLSYLAILAAADNCNCKAGDVKCISECARIPNPSNDMAEKTNACNTQCTLSGGGDACFEGCVQQNYLANQPVVPTAIVPTPTDTSLPETSDASSVKVTATSDEAAKETASDKDPKDPKDVKDDKGLPKKPTGKDSSSSASKSVPSSSPDADSHAAIPVAGSLVAVALPILHYLI